MPLRRLRRSKPIEICLEINKDEWVTLGEISQRFDEIQADYQRRQEQEPEVEIELNEDDKKFTDLYLLMLELMELWTETCLFRNTYCQ